MPLPTMTPVRSTSKPPSMSPASVIACDGGGDGVLRVQVGALRFLAVHVLERIEPLHLAGEADGEVRRVELGDVRRARPTVPHGAPSRRHIVADWRNGTQASDDDPTLHYAPTLVFR